MMIFNTLSKVQKIQNKLLQLIIDNLNNEKKLSSYYEQIYKLTGIYIFNEKKIINFLKQKIIKWDNDSNLEDVNKYYETTFSNIDNIILSYDLGIIKNNLSKNKKIKMYMTFYYLSLFNIIMSNKCHFSINLINNNYHLTLLYNKHKPIEQKKDIIIKNCFKSLQMYVNNLNIEFLINEYHSILNINNYILNLFRINQFKYSYFYLKYIKSQVICSKQTIIDILSNVDSLIFNRLINDNIIQYFPKLNITDYLTLLMMNITKFKIPILIKKMFKDFTHYQINEKQNELAKLYIHYLKQNQFDYINLLLKFKDYNFYHSDITFFELVKFNENKFNIPNKLINIQNYKNIESIKSILSKIIELTDYNDIFTCFEFLNKKIINGDIVFIQFLNKNLSDKQKAYILYSYTAVNKSFKHIHIQMIINITNNVYYEFIKYLLNSEINNNQKYYIIKYYKNEYINTDLCINKIHNFIRDEKLKEIYKSTFYNLNEYNTKIFSSLIENIFKYPELFLDIYNNNINLLADKVINHDNSISNNYLNIPKIYSKIIYTLLIMSYFYQSKFNKSLITFVNLDQILELIIYLIYFSYQYNFSVKQKVFYYVNKLLFYEFNDNKVDIYKHYIYKLYSLYLSYLGDHNLINYIKQYLYASIDYLVNEKKIIRDEIFIYFSEINSILISQLIVKKSNNNYIITIQDTEIINYTILENNSIFNHRSINYYIIDKPTYCIICLDNCNDYSYKLCENTNNDHFMCHTCILEYIKIKGNLDTNNYHLSDLKQYYCPICKISCDNITKFKLIK